MACNIDIGFYIEDIGETYYPCPICECDEYDCDILVNEICISCKREQKINEILKDE